MVVPVTYRKVVRDEAKKFVEECICEVVDMEGERPEWLGEEEFSITATVDKTVKNATCWITFPHFKNATMTEFARQAYAAVYIRDSYDSKN